MSAMLDILIIGAGPAGLTAALYAARAGKSVGVYEKEAFGGQIVQAHRVANYPGAPDIGGMELGDRLCAQAMDAGADVAFAAVSSLTRNADGSFTAETEDGAVDARAVIFAGGAKPRKLALPKEDDFIGHGVSYCALCDGAFFADCDVAVVGGGNTAFSDAMALAEVCRSVTIIHRRNAFRAEAAVVEAARAVENIRFMTPFTIDVLKGEDKVEGLVLTNAETGAKEELALSGVFVAWGRVPDSDMAAPFAELDAEGFLASDENCETKTPGFFVAGDCRKKKVRQLTTAVADGTVAATAACEYLDRLC